MTAFVGSMLDVALKHSFHRPSFFSPDLPQVVRASSPQECHTAPSPIGDDSDSGTLV